LLSAPTSTIYFFYNEDYKALVHEWLWKSPFIFEIIT
jgi:hypothetical protein